MLLESKVAIVTGAAQGIGRACAERLAREGAHVVLADVNAELGTALAAAIGTDRTKAVFKACDVADQHQARALVAFAVSQFGHVDVLVNNAGVVDDCPFLELSAEEFDRILAINLRGAFVLAQAAARQMVGQAADAKGFVGAIVNMSSINAWFGLPDHVAYSVSKGGLMQLTKSMAVALAPHGIRVNAVGPGTIETPLIAGVVKDAAFRKKVLSRTPIGRFGKPEEIAAVVAWLASAEASYLTGTTIYADGGRMPLNYVMPTAD